MATFNSIADEVTRKLAGFTLRNDRQTYLTSALTSSALSIPVNNASNASTGLLEIGDELIYVESFSRTDNTFTVPPYGRGYGGTEARSHTSGSKVVISPTFPRADVKSAINETINAVFPSLFAVNSAFFNFSPAISTYALPDECETVLAVSYQTTGPTKEWAPVRSWRVDPNAKVTAFNSKNTISIYGGVEPGREVMVTYTAAPSELLSDEDDFAITTGLPESAKDVISLGAQWRLVSSVDPARLTYGSAESDQQSQVAGRAYGAGTNAAKFLLALYEKRLAEESAKLLDRNPIRIHFTR